MKKYMFVTPTLSLGGAERVVSVLSTALSQKREVVVVKYHSMPGEYPVGGDVKVINLSDGDRAAYEGMTFLQKLKKLRMIIAQEKPDYIIPFLLRVCMTAAVAAIGLKTTVLQTVRADPANVPVSKKLRAVRDAFVCLSKRSIVQNERQRQYFPAWAHKKIHILYNPVSEGLFEVVPKEKDDNFVICSMGRLEEQKNFPMLVDAVQRAREQASNISLRIYGSGTQQEALQSYISQHQLQDHVHLMGRVDNVASAFGQADLFILSSNFEGMPNALLEAMAAGLPCISTDCPTGPSELIDQDESGILVPVNDAQAMFEAIMKLHGSDALRAEMAKKGRESVRQKCSPDKIIDKLIAICEDM